MNLENENESESERDLGSARKICFKILKNP